MSGARERHDRVGRYLFRGLREHVRFRTACCRYTGWIETPASARLHGRLTPAYPSIASAGGTEVSSSRGTP
jgi:hypothetical protein